jgi:hypothetical protein
MEILIVGLMLVALMVYASTRIKRTAAEAFESERVETDEFIIEKPDGFLNVLNRDASLEFDAYSKEFGVDQSSGFRAARAELRIHNSQTMNDLANSILGEIKVSSDVSEIMDGRKYRVIEGESVEKGVGFRELYKLAESEGRVFEMKLKMLEDADPNTIKKAELMVASFEIR